MQGLTESKVSQRVQHYEQRQGLTEGTGGKALTETHALTDCRA